MDFSWTEHDWTVQLILVLGFTIGLICGLIVGRFSHLRNLVTGQKELIESQRQLSYRQIEIINGQCDVLTELSEGQEHLLSRQLDIVASILYLASHIPSSTDTPTEQPSSTHPPKPRDPPSSCRDKVCYSCGVRGHVAKWCPQRRAQGSSRYPPHMFSPSYEKPPHLF